MCHGALEKLFALGGGLSRDDGRWFVMITVTGQPAQMDHVNQKPGHPVGYVAVIELPLSSPSWAPQSSITYLWIV